ncbi:hypothetical protein NQ318_013696 [Aromia moschata]|uniref:Acyltransferase 3 domain-containing protein n=1 Tax=Aromia moschata TaxID=1265417 RepID=A0AAV8Z9A9_9CUCU|nr:hypothetical protein NQ318_013696 [Aromia moschata]
MDLQYKFEFIRQHLICVLTPLSLDKIRNSFIALFYNMDTLFFKYIHYFFPIIVSIVELVSKNSSTESLPRSSTLGEIIKCFSFYSNTKNLVKTKLSPDSVGCIHGLRFIGMLWVVAVHAVYYQADYIKNVPFAYRLSEDIFAQILSNATYCVDTYLFLRCIGFLVAYLYYSKKNPHEQPKQTRSLFTKTNEFFMMYINRSARLTPPYLFIILFVDVIYTLFRQFSSLMSSEMADVVCEKYWWRNLIYINNLFPRKEIAFKLTAVITFLLIFINIAATGYKSYMIGYIPT